MSLATLSHRPRDISLSPDLDDLETFASFISENDHLDTVPAAGSTSALRSPPPVLPLSPSRGLPSLLNRGGTATRRRILGQGENNRSMGEVLANRAREARRQREGERGRGEGPSTTGGSLGSSGAGSGSGTVMSRSRSTSAGAENRRKAILAAMAPSGQNAAPSRAAGDASGSPAEVEDGAARRRRAIRDALARHDELEEVSMAFSPSLSPIDDEANVEQPLRLRPRQDVREAQTGGLSSARPAITATFPRRMAPLPRRDRSIEIIDLRDDSDSDDSNEDIVVTGANINARAPPSSRVVRAAVPAQPQPQGAASPRFPEAAAGVMQLDRLLQAREAQHEAIINDSADERRRAVLSPPYAPALPAYIPHSPPRAPLHPIGLGGAVLRNGSRQVNWNVGRAGGGGGGGGGGAYAWLGRLAGGAGAALDRALGWGEIPYADRLGADFRQLVADMGAGGPLAGGAGPAGIQRDDDVKRIIKSVSEFFYPDPPKGFLRDFELPTPPPVYNEDGKAIAPTSERYFACANPDCKTFLRCSAGHRTPDDRTWLLQCGHVLNQPCFTALSVPSSAAELASILPPIGDALDAPPPTKRRKGRGTKAVPAPRTYLWRCPVKGCGREHVSRRMPDKEEWAQVEGEGALQMYT